ncbi:MAG: hypothetical protein NTW97_02705 [Candidatus Krumholzibacteria bacterium]|nr:hypothetical protein [Candidatus Krumholzibacteria bacterium]
MRTATLAILCVLLAAAAIAGCARSEGQEKKIAAPAKVNNAVAPRDQAAERRGDGAAAEALRRAASENKHLFVFFFSQDDEATRLARKTIEQAVRGMGRSAEWIAVDIANASEAEIVKKYNIRSAAMPIVIAFAPNGAITGGFRTADINEEKLKGAIASRGMQESMKALQENKLVFICCQGKKTQFNKEAMAGVNDFRADTRYAAYTTVVKIDPADKAEQGFLSQLKMDPNAKDAATAILVPPNMVLGVTNGPTSKAAVLKMLASASSGGCGPKGCGPVGCGPTKK